MRRSARALYSILLASTLSFVGYVAHAGDFDACAEHLPFGAPTVAADLNVTPICHHGYAVLVDNDALVPRWVAYHLTGPHTLGCLPREARFHVDEQSATARPSNYAASGYDIGHMQSAEDGAWDPQAEHDTFSTANVAPQRPHLNREIFERIEDIERAIAWQRGEIITYVGPVITLEDERIGSQGVDAPAAFFKVLVDPKAGQAIGFYFDREGAPKGDPAPFLRPITEIEGAAQIVLPMPASIDKGAAPSMWDFDLSAWRSARRAACSR